MQQMNPQRRRMDWLAAVLLVCMTAPLAGQQPQQTTPRPPNPQQAEPRRERGESFTRVIQVRRGEAERLVNLLGGPGALLQRADDNLGIIVVTGPSESAVAHYEQMVREIEKNVERAGPVVAQNVQLTLHILGIVEDDSSAALPKSLQGIVTELKKTLPFRGYRLLETSTVRGRVGQQVQVQGILPTQPGENTSRSEYEFGARISTVTPQDASIISFSSVGVSLHTAATDGRMNMGVSTTLDMADGSTAVIGKSGASGSTQGYLMLLEAKLLN